MPTSANAFTARCEGTWCHHQDEKLDEEGEQGVGVHVLGGGERRRPANLQSRLLLANLAVLAQNPYGCRRKHNSPQPDVATY